MPTATTASRFPDNIIPDSTHQPGRARRLRATCRCRISDVSNGSNNFDRTAEIHDRADDVHRQGRPPLQRRGLADRLLPLQQDRRAVRQLLGAWSERSRTGSPIRATTSCCAASTCWRSTTRGCRATTRSLTLRYGWTRFIDDNTLSIDFDPGDLGFSPIFLNAIQVDKFPQVASPTTTAGLRAWSARSIRRRHQLAFVGRQRHDDAAARAATR